ncbi:metallophosphoesterase family protein [Roseomonas marmotae]|uniref:Metallophosphoesterase n=1 Tax=Roseomonas marmotae TaxID=2768161 RepID=A0ABS3KEI6_9PROT|nr:metallophosphoesterase [Roseomonas marmotae]MBO1075869.1 metallophosphoesterase [Roseomonas marmotae]QTI81942.1 metallophosphoesterase [Roseomonas marmotae]
MTLVLAHLSDLHLPPQALPGVRQLLGKRLLSYLAWQRKRQRRAELPADLLLEDLESFAPDAVAVTGDLTHFALPDEFAAGRAFLERLGRPARVVAIPGNHDALVPVPWAQGLGLWAEWMRGDGPDREGFPFLRRMGEVALIGLSSAVPTPPGSAAGWLGPAQLEGLSALLAESGRQGLCRVVLIHHPPIGENRRRGLRDRAALLEVLARQGAELLLHGHSHRPALVPLPGPGGSLLPAIGVPQALAGQGHRHMGGWNLYRITRAAGGWVLGAVIRRYDPAEGRFRTTGRWGLALGTVPAGAAFSSAA